MELFSPRPSRVRNDVRPTKAKAQVPAMAPAVRPSALRKLPTVTDLPYRVLLVAGDNVHTQLVKMILLNDDMRVFTAQNATEATASIAAEMPHILIVDWDVDGIDGRAILRAIKTNQETRRLPVLVMTNRAVTDNLKRELTLYGVQWILEKPIVPMSLPKLIVRTLKGESPTDLQGGTFQRRALLIDNGQTASGAMWKSVW